MLKKLFSNSTLSTLRNSIFFKKSNGNMDEEYSILTSHEQLKEFIRKKGVADQDTAVNEYISQVKYPPISDFPKGLEWFNVSEPLSFTKHLKGKVVLLDFFTYCCINCMHILPDLKDIENEFSVEDGLVVIGVHSAKFENEKISSNILAAVQRYNIGHPVVNDNESFMWKNCNVCCWPTLLLLGPNANPIVMLMGEGHKDKLFLYIKNALSYYKAKNEISNHKLPFKSAYHLLPDLKGPLLFPGKITVYEDSQNNSEFIAISDSGNHRILLLHNDGSVMHQVGGLKAGYKDGTLANAEFNSPQGLVFQNSNILFVADTDNHAIRKIDFKNNSVTTIAGSGEQGSDYKGGKQGLQQEISSPWDICLYRMLDLDNKEKDILIIAMAGTHQIWAVFLTDTVWWKHQTYTKDTCVCIAGSGREENKNNQYPLSAGFAQPSGLAINNNDKEVYIADSESSSVRKLSLVDGKVSAVVGGDLNPRNLFAFGDKDGKLHDGKLQHLLGLAMDSSKKKLFVADTYNHKIKLIDTSKNYVSTIQTSTGNVLSKLNEPAGLYFNSNKKLLYVADTNNHSIKLFTFTDNYTITDIEILNINFPSEIDSKIDKKLQVVSSKPLSVNCKGGKIVFAINLNFVEDVSLTSEAPQSWIIDLPNPSWSSVPHCGNDVLNVDTVLNIRPTTTSNLAVDCIFSMMICTTETCLPKKFIVRQPINFSENGPQSLTNSLQVTLDQSTVTIN